MERLLPTRIKFYVFTIWQKYLAFSILIYLGCTVNFSFFVGALGSLLTIWYDIHKKKKELQQKLKVAIAAMGDLQKFGKKSRVNKRTIIFVLYPLVCIGLIEYSIFLKILMDKNPALIDSLSWKLRIEAKSLGIYL